MPFRSFDALSPNRSPAVHERLGVLFHHSGPGFTETIEKMSDPASLVSYHCLIDGDGTRCAMVPDTEIAWHAGASRFHDRARCNDFLLGVAFAGDTYKAALTDAQLESAIAWLEGRWKDRSWGLEWMTDHRQVAPGRKLDLNPPEWERVLAAIAGRFG